jgi:flagellar basal body-associated protein FliL
MSNNTEQLEKTRAFQWIKGDAFGKIVTLKSEDSEFLYFTDGSQIYKSVSGEFLIESEDGDTPLPDTKVTLSDLNINKGNSKTSIIAENVYEDKSPTQISQQIPQQISQQTPEETPLEQLIVKLSKKNSTTLNVPVELNLPRKEIVDLLVDNSEEYDRDAVLAIIVETTLNKININTLRETLKEQINSHLKNYYNE